MVKTRVENKILKSMNSYCEFRFAIVHPGTLRESMSNSFYKASSPKWYCPFLFNGCLSGIIGGRFLLKKPLWKNYTEIIIIFFFQVIDTRSFFFTLYSKNINNMRIRAPRQADPTTTQSGITSGGVFPKSNDVTLVSTSDT